MNCKDNILLINYNLVVAASSRLRFLQDLPDDNNARIFYEGAMKKLGGFIDLGYITVKSGEVKQEDTAIQNWSPDLANKHMNNILR